MQPRYVSFFRVDEPRESSFAERVFDSTPPCQREFTKPPNVRVQVAARLHTAWILSFKLRNELPRLTCNDLLGAVKQPLLEPVGHRIKVAGDVSFQFSRFPVIYIF